MSCQPRCFTSFPRLPERLLLASILLPSLFIEPGMDGRGSAKTLNLSCTSGECFSSPSDRDDRVGGLQVQTRRAGIGGDEKLAGGIGLELVYQFLPLLLISGPDIMSERFVITVIDGELP